MKRQIEKESRGGLKALLGSQRIIALLTLTVLFVFFSLFGKNFFTRDSVVNLFESSYYTLCLAMGMTFIVATGGIDLSIGTVAMCGAVIGGAAYNVWHFPMWLSLIVILLVTMTFGAVNGFMVSVLKIPPFVATMGSMMISQGVGYIVSSVQTMRYPIITDPDGWFKRLFFKTVSGFPMGVFWVGLLFFTAVFLMRYTRFGKYVCAIGSNKEATRLSGVNTRKWEWIAYIVSGVFTGFGGMFYAATYTSVIPGSGSGNEMNALAAVVIGGTSLAGGYGTILGTLIGVFIMSILKNGLLTVGLQQQWQVLFTGLAVLLAVYLDIRRNRKK
ncbi:ABC transporter permease [Lachnospiraceae bacterium 64-25]|nr:ribose import permease protein RbsC [Lachnospiraceae bacterium]